MIVLALDTALNACSVCVARDGEALAIASEPMERLAPMAAQAMKQAGLGFAALDRIGVVVGPGSFTGLRVGLAFAKGLALALDAPCVGVGALEALAAPEPGLTAAVIAGKPGQVYLQVFDAGAALTPPGAMTLEQAAACIAAQIAGLGRPLVLTGPGAALLAPLLPMAEIATRESLDVERLAARGAAAPEPIGRPAPLYLRAPDARTLAERAAQG